MILRLLSLGINKEGGVERWLLRETVTCDIMCTNGRHENGELECYDLIFAQKKPGINMNVNLQVTTIRVQITVYDRIRQMDEL